MIKTKKDLVYYIEQDRIALKKKKNSKVDDIWKYEILLRKAEYFSNSENKVFQIIGRIYKKRLFNLGKKLGGISIGINCFGPGLSIAHMGTIVVNQTARIGKNCRIHEGVTIGATGGSHKAAKIGDNVFIATGAKVIGDVKIADNIAIGANAVVTKSFTESGITLGGVPAKKISCNDSMAFLAPELFNY